MEIMVLLIILAIVVAAASVVIFVLMQQLKRVQNNSAVELIKGDVVELSRSILPKIGRASCRERV